jgi:ABC-type spermidine/putrescine transport system permease subunit II
VVQCGVRNLAISEAAAAHGLYYAPDPSSQIACTIGGNVAENSGGVHCLKYGLTLHNVLKVKGFTIDGDAIEFGSDALDAPGYDLLAVLVGTSNAFLLERTQFRGKSFFSLLMLAPLVIPGVILGISILAFASRVANLADDLWGLELEFLRPGLALVVLGQLSFTISVATLTISARLKRFDITLEEAAYNLGASRAAVLRTITLPYLRPALLGAAAISFLMSFENFNTTLMLVGSDSPLTVMMYGRMREGATPALNAVSLFLMLASGLLALTLLRRDVSKR